MMKDTDIKNSVNEFVSEHGCSKDALLPILQELQKKFSYVPKQAIKYIANELAIYEAEIYGVITFYTQFRLSPCGKNVIKVCKGTACHVGGAETVAVAVKDILNIDEGETTKDGLFTIEYVACIGCCSLAPVMMINEDVHGHLTKDKIQGILRTYATKK